MASLRPGLLILALPLCACPSADPATLDLDGDGVIGADDCDDDDATVFPDATELCDEVDHDCDGATGLEDPDGDGSPDCEDCADNDARRAPTNPEICDPGDLDEDCDGLSDEADPDVDFGPALYPDADNDGLGDASASGLRSCDPPDSFVADNSDCDDTTRAIPAPREQCGDGRDNDCDGTTDVCADIDIQAGPGVIGDSTGWASSIDLTHDLTGDGLADLLVGSPGSTPGAAYVFAGPLTATTISDNVAVILGSGSFDRLGEHVLTGDVTGDGEADAVVFRDAGFGTVEVRIFAGPVLGTYDASSDGMRIAPPEASALIGGTIALSDLDDDGSDDLATGAPLMSTQTGRVHVLLGPIAGDSTMADADVVLHGLASGDRLGDAIAGIGDVDGDGDDDLAACAPSGDSGNGYCGVLTDRDVPGESDIDELTRFYVGEGGEGLGKAVAGGGDLDGDGEADIALVSNTRVALISPKLDAAVTAAMATIDGFSGFDDVFIPGDIDGDGVGDLWLAGRGDDGTTTAWLLHGPWNGGTMDLADLNGSGGPTGTRFTSTLPWTASEPAALSGGGDADGDGTGDLAIGLGDDLLGEVRVWSGWMGAF